MLKKQIVVIALALLSGTMSMAVSGHTREQRAQLAKAGLEAIVRNIPAEHPGNSDKQDIANKLLKERHLSEAYKTKLRAALNDLQACDIKDTQNLDRVSRQIDDLIDQARQNVAAIFEYNPGFISELSDAVDWFPALATDAMSESRTLRIAVVYGVTMYGIYKLHTFFTKASHEAAEHKKKHDIEPAIVVVQP